MQQPSVDRIQAMTYFQRNTIAYIWIMVLTVSIAAAAIFFAFDEIIPCQGKEIQLTEGVDQLCILHEIAQ